MNTTKQAAPAVTITRQGPFLAISPPTDHLGQLAIGRVEPAGETGTGLALHKEPLFGLQRNILDEMQGVVWAGLGPAVLGMYKSAGISVSVPDAKIGRLVADPATVENVADPAVASFVTGGPRGLVRYDDQGVDVLWLIVQICIAFDTAKFVVIVRTKKDAVDLSHLLLRHGITPAVTGDGKVFDIRQRVVVTLLGQMGCVELNKADVVLVADALFSTWEDPLTAELAPDPNDPTVTRVRKATGLLERIADAGNAVVVGFSPCSRQRSPFETARCWQLYGRDELVVPRTGNVERRVVVGSTLNHIGNTAQDSVPYVKNKVRTGHVRNRRVARLARALRVGDAIQVRGILTSPLPATFDGVPQHVLVLAESLKQAYALGKYLPTWPIVSGLGDDERTLKDDEITATRGVIATALGVEELVGDEFDVVVRTDPGSGMPPLPPGWLATPQFPAKELLLVDVQDTGHHLAALWARQRRRTYRAAGWNFLGEDTDITAWKQFRSLVLERKERP